MGDRCCGRFSRPLLLLSLVVTAHVLLHLPHRHDLVGHLQNQHEPKHMQQLQRPVQQKVGPESPPHTEYRRSLEYEAVDAVAWEDHQPRYEEERGEEGEADVRGPGRPGLVLGHLGDVVEALAVLEEYVGAVVHQQDGGAGAEEVARVAHHDECYRDQVVQDHLKGVGARDLRPEELVHVATQLHLVVQSHCGGDWVVGPAHEELQCLVDPGRSGGHKQRVVAERAEAGVEDESPGGLYVLHDLGVRDPVSPPRPQVPLHVQLLAARARAVGLDL
mmetsp:Transcript_35946/g.77572  ORF Transcript_35946/g.77572 Transcript_35946/m.77572 type:complete len:275 (+) Transcript_35946:228-1052(+)